MNRGRLPLCLIHIGTRAYYRTRIYPLPARGGRRIRVTYVAELPTDREDDAACLLPMPIGATVARLVIRVEVSQGVVQPEIGGFGNLRFQAFNNFWIAQTEVRDARCGEDIWAALPKLPAQVTALETDTPSSRFGTDQPS